MPRDKLRDVLEKELVNMVNQVGVDINFCIDHAHAESLVPFLSGFGPRKAAVLLKVCYVNDTMPSFIVKMFSLWTVYVLLLSKTSTSLVPSPFLRGD